MVKEGVINENTPPDQSQSSCCGGRCKGPPTKEAADRQEAHPTTRAAEAVHETIVNKR